MGQLINESHWYPRTGEAGAGEVGVGPLLQLAVAIAT
jgi:hypothetical protein